MHHSEEVNQMHHQLENDQAPFKTKEALALKELNEMTIREDAKIEDVNAKIEEKVKYDKGVLNRSEVK